jgi:hypothetical protein
VIEIYQLSNHRRINQTWPYHVGNETRRSGAWWSVTERQYGQLVNPTHPFLVDGPWGSHNGYKTASMYIGMSHIKQIGRTWQMRWNT